MLRKPRNGGGARAVKLTDIGIEMSALDGHKLLRFNSKENTAVSAAR
jgi:hypothetical protein